MICPACGEDNPARARRCRGCSGALPSEADSASDTASVDSRAGLEPGPYLEPDSEFGSRYRIERLIGEGGMGSVYRAHDRELERTVALKLLQPGRDRDPRALQRFKQELLLARTVSHRNILRIHDLGDVDGIKFISMEYVEGLDLQALIQREGRLPLPRALGVARQLCDALQAAHDAGVLHRDLKPHNVLMGPGDHVFVSDFGLAKSLEDTDAGLTRTGDVLGTPRYMSPEQVEGQPLDHRSDLYGLGLILYEMVTGHVPFEGVTPTQQMIQRVRQRPKDPREFNPDLPDHWRQIILRCLEREPAARYASAREVAQDLVGERVSRAPVTGSSRQVSITLPIPSRRGWVAAAAILALLSLSLLLPGVRSRVASWLRAGGDGHTVVERKRVAVLPFKMMGTDAELAHLGPGLADSLAAKLFAVQSLNVASSAVAERAGKKDSLDKAARDAGASVLVTGTVQGGEGRLRIVVNVEDMDAHQRLSSREYSLVPKDLLTVEDQIYQELLSALAVGPSSEERARADSGSTESIEAYELYLKGRNAARASADLKSVEAAVGFYQQALAKDARFALAYAGLANACMRLYRGSGEAAWSQRGIGAAEQAKSIAGDLLEVRVAMANVYQNTGKTNEAIAELREAVTLAPGSDDAYRRLGRAYLTNEARKEEGLKALEMAIKINPYHWVNHHELALAYYRLGDYDKAIAADQKVIALEPDNAIGHNDLGAMYLLTGRYPEAAAEFRKSLTIQETAETYNNVGLSLVYSGKLQEAVPMFEKAVQLAPSRELHVGNLGDAYRWTGQKEKAAAMYQRAIELTQKDLQVNPQSAGAKADLALHYAKAGQDQRARQYIEQAKQLSANDHTIMTSEAVVHALAGRIPEGLAALERALAAGLRPSYVEADPNLAALRQDPRYQEVIGKRTAPASR
ncbi:MAG TPA: protein kinase [Vicinamibacteria bacterium]